MSLLLFWVLLSIAIAVWASKKGRSAGGWLVLSLLVSPLLAGTFLAIADDKTAEAEEKRYRHLTHVRCPDCRELIRKDARKCKHCGTALAPEQA